MIDELIAGFAPETFSEWCRDKFDRFTADPHDVPNDEGFPKARVVGYVQTLPDDQTNRPLLVMSVHAGPQIDERSSRRRQFDFARKQLLAAIDKPPAKVKGLFTQGLFAFHDDEGNFRLSLVSGRSEGKKLVFSDFKRQSFFVHPARKNKTFRTRMAPAFTSYDNLSAAFSVETLTKEFYNNLFSWYERALAPESKVSFPNDVTSDDDDRAQLPEHLIRLITRLMFIWFIRQKNLIPDQIFDTDALKKTLKAFDPLSRKQDNYYRAILQNLFFATLNCEINKRNFAKDGSFKENQDHFDIKILYRYRDDFAISENAVLELFRQVPFLNGGLFECLDKKTDYQDGFSRNPKHVAHIPNNLFFDDHGLITLFSQFDFTVDENDPNDSDVALDPELLGKVFENLLGAYNPETRETARKQSGSFYTPREIVNYMVDESLVAHLRTQAPEIDEPVIRQFLGGEASPVLAAAPRRQLVTALYHCRILDPACGSGAFPMGLLLKMVHLLQRLDPANTLWHEVVMAEAEKALSEAESLDADEKRQHRQRITESFDQDVNQPDYARKLYLIENCIFGSDIQPIAVQIAKLRTFITLVCDQTPDPTDAAHNYRMLPLPNLETKFVAANSLIGLSADFAEGLKPAEGGSRLDDPVLVHLRSRLAEVRHRHFRARDSREKNDCRKQDRELREKIKSRLVEIACKPDKAKIAFYQEQIDTLAAKRKRVASENWQDVIQTAPQQGTLFDSDPVPVQSVMRIDVNKEARDNIDDEIRRFTRSIETEQNRAQNKSAFQEEADRLAAWDPYDQNASSPFFDPGWMFGFKGGFDIVIGNPPYGFRKIHNDKAKAYFRQHFSVVRGSYEHYFLFYEASLRMLRQHGVLVFIAPVTWLTIPSAQALRELVLLKYAVSEITWFSDAVFTHASVNTAITFLHCAAHGNTRVRFFDDLSAFPMSPKKERSIPQQTFINGGCYFSIFTDSTENGILDKIKQSSVPLGQLAGPCSGYNPYEVGSGIAPDGGVHTKETVRSKPYHSQSKCGKDWKAEIVGRDLQRYCVNVTGKRWVKYGPWLAACRDPQNFQGKRILVQEITGGDDRRIVAAYYFGELYHSRDVIPVKLTQVGAHPFFLLGIINSRLISWYHLKNSPKAQKALFPKVLVSDLAKLPIPILPDDEQEPIVNLVELVVAAKKTDPNADTTRWEHDIDELVYHIYGLTDAEIAIVEGRDATAKPHPVAKPSKPAAGRRPRKSVMTEDPDLE